MAAGSQRVTRLPSRVARAAPATLVAALAVASAAVVAGEGDAEVCSLEAAATGSAACAGFGGEGEHFWPVKNGDMRRTGKSAFSGPSDVTKPAWVFEVSETRDTFLCSNFPRGLAIVVGYVLVVRYFYGVPLGVLGVALVGLRLACRRRLPRLAKSLVGLGAVLVWTTVALLQVNILIHAPWALNDGACGVMYQSPVIDRRGNIFLSASDGWLLAFKPDGTELWRSRTGGKQMHGVGQIPTPALSGESLFVVSGFGEALALDLLTGAERWRARYAEGRSGLDSWSVGVRGDVVYVMGFPQAGAPLHAGSGSHLYALSAHDGSLMWTFELEALAYNIMPAVIENYLVFSDQHGGMYCLDLATGRRLWFMPGSDPNSFTTGDAAVGPNKVAYVTSNIGHSHVGSGNMRAYDLVTGRMLWNTTFALTANAAPVVYRDAKGWKVVTGLGPNGAVPWPHSLGIPESERIMDLRGQLVAVDGDSGDIVWTFEPPVHRGPSAAGATISHYCMPDSWTNAAVGADGIVYAGWHDGTVFALNGSTGALISRYDMRSAMQGEPAIAPGMLVVVSCDRMAVFF